MGLSIGHILIVLVIVLVLFGAGKLPRVMGDMGKGIKSFKAGLNDRDEDDRVRDDRSGDRLRDEPKRLDKDNTPPSSL